MNQLELLKKFTIIVADTSDIDSICKYKPADATTNPSLILQAVKLNTNRNFLDQAVKYAKKIGGSKEDQLENASDKILVDLGIEILKYIPGYISSEVDARLSFNKEKCILKAKKIIKMYEDQGISRERILIKLATTWECIKAAEELKKDNIFCNLTLLFSFAQARACAEANVFLISPFVGRIYDWYIAQNLISNSSYNKDPGVTSVCKIYDFYKKHNYKTIIMGASFRNTQQILSLSGCDRLTISPVLLKELELNSTVFNRKLIPPTDFSKPPVPLTEEEFRWEHNQDEMAVQKLSEGIRNFGKDQIILEQIIEKSMCLEKELSNAIRMLSIDAVQYAKSGHPGMPMGMADIAEVLWRNFLKHSPKNPKWDNRDRFILSNGHGSMLLYSLLHLTGYNLSIEDIKKFRTLDSKTPGHPEIEETPGVETTTGPLGQGLANAVGMAIAEKTLGAYFNRLNYDIVNHYTWVFVGDGCLMEGISHEVCSLAGTLKLGKLIVFYDSNGISIDGKISNWFTDDTVMRFKSYNWHVIDQVNGHDPKSIMKGIKEAVFVKDQPSIIICNTIIGFGSPNKSGTSESHGAPLGESEITLTRKNLKWNYLPFEIPQKIYDKWNFVEQGLDLEKEWNKKFSLYKLKYPQLAEEYLRRFRRDLPVKWNQKTSEYIIELQNKPKNIASRNASQNILEKFAKLLPELIGGSADLSPSNLTICSSSSSITENASGNYIHYGVREFGMTAIANGIAHHGGFIPYTSTFLMFVEYARNAVRMAALMNTKHIFVYTHDSIGLGEDGPTHQPIEQLANLRMTPNIDVWRPCDQVETAIAWKRAIEKKEGPTALILSRQNLSQFHRNSEQLKNISYGAYILYDSKKPIDVIFISTGSEVEITLLAAKEIISLGYSVRVVSMPSNNVFDRQKNTYKELILPSTITKRIAIEASAKDFWYKYVGINGLIIGMETFGKSAPADILFKKFGFTVENIVNKAKIFLKH